MNTLTLRQQCKFSFADVALTLLVVCIISAGATLGQKKPTALKLDADADDKTLCANSPLNDSEFCDFYEDYTGDDATPEEKLQARNDMIDLVRGQVDTYYKLRKDGRKTKIRWLQTLLDFLEVGAASSIAIMNGERARGVVGAALSGFQGGRTAFNKNFEILQTQVLINKMNANRAEIFTEIARNKTLPATSYSWYAAKNDLRRYLFAGTFNNALDSLVTETGAETAAAEEELRVVESTLLLGAVTADQLAASSGSREALTELETALAAADPDTRNDALATLRSIVTELNKNETVRLLLAAKGVATTSDGLGIIAGLRTIRRELTIVGKDDLTKHINDAIIKEHTK